MIYKADTTLSVYNRIHSPDTIAGFYWLMLAKCAYSYWPARRYIQILVWGDCTAYIIIHVLWIHRLQQVEKHFICLLQQFEMPCCGHSISLISSIYFCHGTWGAEVFSSLLKKKTSDSAVRSGKFILPLWGLDKSLDEGDEGDERPRGPHCDWATGGLETEEGNCCSVV